MSVDKQELYSSDVETKARQELVQLFKECPIPESDILNNLGLFINSKNLGRLLFMNYLYTSIVNVHGCIMEFGTRWGQNVAMFSALRAVYEPYNRSRKIVAFDTFSGFPEVTAEDGENLPFLKVGGLATTTKYEHYLEKILSYHEFDNPMGHVRRFEIVKGEAVTELHSYFKRNPETIIALAYFDFDIYKPTKNCLRMIKNRLPKGAIVAFDELADHDSPGETVALQEVFGIENIKLQRLPFVSRVSYFVKE